MNKLDIQIASQSIRLPSRQQLQTWVDLVLHQPSVHSSLGIRIIDEPEMVEFNQKYRNKQGSTNILSFPFEPPSEIANDYLGDLLICAPVVEREALAQQKQWEHHWAHIVIHGLLHLLGYDHIDHQEAEEMEQLEIKLLKQITIKNPYKEHNS